MEATSAEMLADLERGAQRAADAIAHGAAREEEALQSLLRDAGAHYLGISGNGEESAQATVDSVGEPPPVLARLLADPSAAEQSGVAEGWLYATGTIRSAAGGSARLLVGRTIPASILQDQAFVQAQVAQWKHLEAARPVAWRIYVYKLALITIFTLFIAVWLAQFASRQITRPVKALLDATGELAGGHLDYRVQTAAIDELGSLVESFNSMGQALQAKTGQLERSNRDLARANAEIDERRQMIDAILESITPGVISVDENGKILKYNESARSFAAKRPLPSLDSVVEVLDEPQQSAFEHMFGSARRTGVATREFEVKRGGEPRHLSVTVSSLDSGQAQSGFVVVFEDNTELVRAQRSEAWQEVARRLAHEIKNPLTPVALAAGRIEVQLDRYAAAKTDAERAAIRDTLESLTRTIDREVRSLNTLVSSFSDVARFPTIRPEANDINAVVRDAVSVFDGRLPGIDLRLITDPEVAQAGDRSAGVQAGARQPDRQRRRRAPGELGQGDCRHHPRAPRLGRRGGDRGRFRSRHLCRKQGAPVPAVLLHQESGEWPRPADRAQRRGGTRRLHSSRGQPARRNTLRDRTTRCHEGAGEAAGGPRMSAPGRVLVVDDEDGIREMLTGVLDDEGYAVEVADCGERCLEMLSTGAYAVVLLDIWLPGNDGLETLERIRDADMARKPVVVMISGHGSVESAVRATKLGAHDFLEKPLSVAKVTVAVRNAVEHRNLLSENSSLRAEIGHRYRILGDSVPMKAVRQQIELMAPTNGRVLIFGESGTGKELVAHAIHARSQRSSARFVEVNCATIPEDLIESELFGHVKGAFPGALAAKAGEVPLGRRRHSVSRRGGRHEPEDPGQGA